MKTSDQINELAAALAKAQAAMQPAAKDTKNDFFKSKYADLASVWEVCRKPLTDNGLSVIQLPECSEGGLIIATRLMHSSGQWMQSDLLLHPTKNDPQGVGSAITYGRRYGLCAMVGIVADEDDDGNAASVPQKKQEQRQEAKPPTAKLKPATEELTPERKGFNEWAAEQQVKGRLSKEEIGQAVKDTTEDGVANYPKARETLEAKIAAATAA